MGNSSSNGRWRVRHEGHVQGVGGERDSTSDKDQEECEHKVKGVSEQGEDDTGEEEDRRGGVEEEVWVWEEMVSRGVLFRGEESDGRGGESE